MSVTLEEDELEESTLAIPSNENYIESVDNGIKKKKIVKESEKTKTTTTEDGVIEQKVITKDVEATIEADELQASKMSKFRKKECITNTDNMISSETRSAFVSSETIRSETFDKDMSTSKVVTKSIKSSTTSSSTTSKEMLQ